MEIKEQGISPGATPESSARESEPEQQTIVTELNLEGKVKPEVIQSSIEPCDRVTYGQRLRDGAQKLEISVRSVQRLFKKYQEQGLVALITTERADRGQHRISAFWQEFILNTYKTGNKGSRRMTPKQHLASYDRRKINRGLVAVPSAMKAHRDDAGQAETTDGGII
jgi:hypothetical protein